MTIKPVHRLNTRALIYRCINPVDMDTSEFEQLVDDVAEDLSEGLIVALRQLSKGQVLLDSWYGIWPDD